MIKFKKGDKILVTSGKDKGRDGVIEKVFPKKDKVLVPAVNLYKKHVKGNLTVDGKGGIFELPRPINVAKIAIVCPNCQKPTRIGFKLEKDKKVRVCKKCGKEM